MVRPDRLAGRQGEADAFGNGLCSPGFAGAEAIDATGAQVRHHLRRRQHERLHVPQRIDAMGGEPVIEPERVGAGGEGMCQGQACTAMAHAGAQCLGIGHACRLQRGGQVDALAVLRQAHEHGHVHCRAAADAQMHRIDQAVQPVGRVQLAADQLVAQGRPGVLPLQVERQSERLGETLGGGDDQRGGIGERQKAEVDRALFRCIAAGDPGECIVSGRREGRSCLMAFFRWRGAQDWLC